MDKLEGTMKSLPWSRGSDEELGAIGILSSVGHAKKTLLGVLQLEVLIRELCAIDYQPLALNQFHAFADTYLTFHQFHHPW